GRRLRRARPQPERRRRPRPRPPHGGARRAGSANRGGRAGPSARFRRENRAGVRVEALIEYAALDHGCELTIEKGIPLGSGLGGSAASAVAAVVAVNALLDRPLDNLRLLKFAMQGELVASGTAHIDN